MQDYWRHPFLPCEEPVDWMLMSPLLELSSSHHLHNGNSFLFRCELSRQGMPPSSWGAYSESEWEWESVTKCKVSASGQCQTGETPQGWVNRKLHTFLIIFSGASLLDQGWRIQCGGKGICGHQCQHSWGRGTDHTNVVRKIWPIMISSNPLLSF